jgi:hypothetical protein
VTRIEHVQYGRSQIVSAATHLKKKIKTTIHTGTTPTDMTHLCTALFATRSRRARLEAAGRSAASK